MTCDDARALLHGYLDSELDLVNAIAVERHIQACTHCGQEYDNLRNMRTVIRKEARYFAAPSELQERIRLALPAPASAPAPATRAPVVVSGRRWAIGSLAFACVALIVLAFARSWFAPTSEDLLAQDVLSSHLRSLMVSHLADVASTDQHTVKPWFNGRLDFSPPVTDFASQGFPLVGGRLDYLDNRPVAALVYHRHLHVINLFIWPATDAHADPTRGVTQQGYYLFHWTKDGMTYWAVSDLSPSELQSFVLLVQGQNTQPLPT